MEKQHPPLVRTRLSIMMFLEFFVWGSWGVAITGYAAKLGFGESQIGWLGAVPAVGAIISPLFVGLIADRFFPAQRMLSVLHLLGGGFLIFAGFQDSFPLLMVAMLLNGLAFMPTIALVNSVAFRHIPDPDKFPRIAVLGTVGWIVAVIVPDVFLGGTAESNFLFQAGVGGIVLGFYALTLPNTPPKGAEAGGDVFGLSALKLFKERSFLIFIVCVFLLSVPACGYFFTLMVPMLQQRGYPSPLALTSLNQFAEIIFMFSMPWFVSKLGLKRVILIGMTAWAVRYLCFACPTFPLAVIGLILHGFCYSFFYVGAYMWVDRRAPAELKSSAQSLLAFLLLGVGYLLGAKGAGFMMGQFPAEIPHMPTYSVVVVGEPDPEVEADKADEAGDPDKVAIPNRVLVKQRKETGEPKTVISLSDATAKLEKIENSFPRWDDPKTKESFWRFLNLSKTVAGMLQSAEEKAKAEEKNQEALLDRLDTDKDGAISKAEIKAVGKEGLVIDAAGDGGGKLTFTKEDLTETFKGIRKSNPVSDADSVKRSHWLAAALDRDLFIQLDTDGKEGLSLEEVKAADDAGVYVGGVTYAKEDLVATFKQAQKVLNVRSEVPLERLDWLKVQSNGWAWVWIYPSIYAFVILAIFALAFRDKPQTQRE